MGLTFILLMEEGGSPNILSDHYPTSHPTFQLTYCWKYLKLYLTSWLQFVIPGIYSQCCMLRNLTLFLNKLKKKCLMFLIKSFYQAIQKELIFLNVTQCLRGHGISGHETFFIQFSKKLSKVLSPYISAETLANCKL